MTATWEIREGDALELLRAMPDESIQCCVTSPPYWGLRDYGVDGQIGLEATPAEHVAALAEVFREVRRVLRADGTLWLNLGDCYAGLWGAQSRGNSNGEASSTLEGRSMLSARSIAEHPKTTGTGSLKRTPGLKPKDLIGIPWMVAFALRSDGWWLRAENIWGKPNGLPESVRDRPARHHEQLFLLAKSARYYYDADAIREDDGGRASGNGFAGRFKHRLSGGLATGGTPGQWEPGAGRGKRSVWWVPVASYSEAHFATFPPKLIEPCVLAGSKPGDTILDPFAGAATTGLVALRHDRSFIGLELNPAYAELGRERIRRDAPLLNTPAEATA